jgi:hypothetical protein
MSVIAQTMTWSLMATPHGVPVQSTTIWDDESPLEVKLLFNVGLDEPVEWVFARDLFLDAIQKNRAGEADVQCEVHDDTLTLRINSPFGEAQFMIEASIVGQFLATTYGKVPKGEENYDLDQTIAKIFEAESA